MTSVSAQNTIIEVSIKRKIRSILEEDLRRSLTAHGELVNAIRSVEKNQQATETELSDLDVFFDSLMRSPHKSKVRDIVNKMVDGSTRTQALVTHYVRQCEKGRTNELTPCWNRLPPDIQQQLKASIYNRLVVLHERARRCHHTSPTATREQIESLLHQLESLPARVKNLVITKTIHETLKVSPSVLINKLHMLWKASPKDQHWMLEEVAGSGQIVIKLENLLLNNLHQPIANHRRLVGSIAAAPTTKPTWHELKTVLTLFRKIQLVDNLTTTRNPKRNVLIIRKAAIRREVLTIFRTEPIESLGRYIHVLNALHNVKPSPSAFVKRWRLLSQYSRESALVSFNSELLAMGTLAAKISKAKQDTLKKEVFTQIAFLHTFPDSTRKILEQDILDGTLKRSLRIARMEMETLREQHQNTNSIKSNRYNGARGRKSTSLRKGAIFLLDKINDYLHHHQIFYTNKTYVNSAFSFRSSLSDTGDLYEYYSCVTTHRKALDYINHLQNKRAELEYMSSKRVTNNFFVELHKLETKIRDPDTLLRSPVTLPKDSLRRLMVYELRLFWLNTTTNTSRYTSSKDQTPVIYKGSFYKYVEKELDRAGLSLCGSKLKLLITSVCNFCAQDKCSHIPTLPSYKNK